MNICKGLCITDSVGVECVSSSLVLHTKCVGVSACGFFFLPHSVASGLHLETLLSVS